MTSGRALVFLHIPKTAGSTLRQVIRRHYPPEVICDVPPETWDEVSAARLSQIRVLMGHVPFGVHERLSVPADYVTLLREPVDRIVSLYYYVVQRGEAHPLHPLVRGRSLDEFVATRHDQLVNAQVRQLSGIDREPDAAALAQAKRNLATGMIAFGTDERFDESLLLFRRALGWRRVHYRRSNVTARRKRLAELPAGTIAAIERQNALDVELFAFARRLLDERIAAGGDAFADELRRFRRINPLFARVTRGLVAAGRFAPRPLRRLARRAGLV